MKPLRIALIGAGAIATGLLELLADDASIAVVGLVVRALPPPGAGTGEQPGQPTRVATSVEGLGVRPDLLVECAGHAALVEHVIPALRAGIPAVVASTGALADASIALQLEQAARAGGVSVHLTPGAVGGIDALAAARLGGLDQVTYVGRKPPQAWRDTPAQARVDLAALRTATVIFEGSAREAAALYPRNANVAATVALAGLGLDETRVTLMADPAVVENVHSIAASGAFGRFEITLHGRPLASNPKTSALTVFSVARAVRNLAAPLVL